MDWLATEGPNEIFVFIADPFSDVVNWRRDDKRQHRLRHLHEDLEKEFGCKFSATNIGPGGVAGLTDVPAFVTTIPNASIPAWTILIGAFFLGKSIKSNLDAWIEMAEALRVFCARPAYFSQILPVVNFNSFTDWFNGGFSRCARA